MSDSKEQLRKITANMESLADAQGVKPEWSRELYFLAKQAETELKDLADCVYDVRQSHEIESTGCVVIGRPLTINNCQ